MFLRPQSVLQYVRYQVPFQVAEVYRQSNEASDDDAGEDNTCLAYIESVYRPIDKRKDLKERIIDSIRQRRIQIDKKYRWVLETYLHRLNDRIRDNGCEAHALPIDLRLCPYIHIPGNLPKSSGAV